MLAIRPDQVRLLRTNLRDSRNCRRVARFRSKNLPLCRSVIWVEYMLNDQHAAVWSHSIPAIAQGLWAGKLLTRRTRGPGVESTPPLFTSEDGIERRLAAVLAADVENSSQHMGEDEVGALRSLAALRSIMDARIARWGGRIANTAGDSVLAKFSTITD